MCVHEGYSFVAFLSFDVFVWLFIRITAASRNEWEYSPFPVF